MLNMLIYLILFFIATFSFLFSVVTKLCLWFGWFGHKNHSVEPKIYWLDTQCNGCLRLEWGFRTSSIDAMSSQFANEWRGGSVGAIWSVILLFHWSEIPLKPTKIGLLCAIGMCKHFTWVNRLSCRQVFIPSARLWSKHKTQVNTLDSDTWSDDALSKSSGGVSIRNLGWDSQMFYYWTVLEAESCSFLWKLLCGVLKPTKLDFLARKTPGSLTELANFQLSACLTWRWIQ